MGILGNVCGCLLSAHGVPTHPVTTAHHKNHQPEGRRLHLQGIIVVILIILIVAVKAIAITLRP